MKKLAIYTILVLAMALSVTAASVDLYSDTDTQYYNGTGWQDSALAWVHSAWTANVNIPGAAWVWRTYQVTAEEAVSGSKVTFKEEFQLPHCASNIRGTIDVTTDNGYSMIVNNGSAYTNGDWKTVVSHDISSDLIPGLNVIVFDAYNAAQANGVPTSNPAGLIYHANIEYDGCDVPEFSLLGGLALAGLAGLFIFFKRR